MNRYKENIIKSNNQMAGSNVVTVSHSRRTAPVLGMTKQRQPNQKT